MILRRYQSSDCQKLIELFRETVHTINATTIPAYNATLGRLPISMSVNGICGYPRT